MRTYTGAKNAQYIAHGRAIFGPCLLWPNGWMDQDGTWHRGSLGPVHIVLDGDTAPLPQKGAEPPPHFRPIFIVAKRLDASRCHLVCREASAQATLCSMWTQLPPEKEHTHPTQFLSHVCCGQMAGWMKTPLGTEVDLGLGHIVLDVVPAPAKGT